MQATAFVQFKYLIKSHWKSQNKTEYNRKQWLLQEDNILSEIQVWLLLYHAKKHNIILFNTNLKKKALSLIKKLLTKGISVGLLLSCNKSIFNDNNNIITYTRDASLPQLLILSSEEAFLWR